MKGKAVAVKLGAIAVWGGDATISYLGDVPGATVQVTATANGFEGCVSLTRVDPVRDGGGPPAQYTFYLKAVRVQGKFGGLVQVTSID